MADVDAWLVTKHLADHPGSPLREALRSTLLTSQASRLTAFYQGRFNNDPDNIASCLVGFIDGIDIAGLGNFPPSMRAIKAAADYETPATTEQATVCAHVFGERLRQG